MFAKRFIEFINISVLFNVVFAVRESGQAKCAFSFVTGTAVCEDVNSFHEIAHEIRSTWINIKINNRLGGSFAMVIRESEISDQMRYVETLDLSAIGHVTISDVGFKPFYRLLRLNLSDTSLKTIDSDWFDVTNSIVRLDLSHNEITQIQRSTMQTLRKLADVNFADNNIESIDDGAFDDVDGLVSLDLHFNRIRSLPQLGNLIYLKVLDLSENAIAEIPYGIFNGLRALQNLTLAQNSILSITGRAFAGAENLEFLNISGNSIRQLSPNIFTSVQMKVLDLSRNDIKNILDDTFLRLRLLETLDLRKNSMQRLAENTFSGLIGVKHLMLANNDISSIGYDTFAGMHSLTHLDLSFNSLTQITGQIFGVNRLPLRKLLVRNNYLDVLPGDMFDSVPNVDLLSLAHNRITGFDDALFAPLKRLRKLHIQNNAITELSATFMEQVSKLVELQLRRNRLTFLPLSNTTFSNLEKITLDGNPWQCPCLFEIFQFITRRRIEYSAEGNDFFLGKKPLCYATPVIFCVRDPAVIEREGVVGKYEAAIHLANDGDSSQ